MAPPEKLKPAVVQMFIDLATCEYAIRSGAKEGRWRNWATNILVGCLYFGMCNSRPGPWQYFNKATFDQMLVDNRDYWLSIKGVKLSQKKGARGTYVSPGIMEACRLYLRIPGSTGNGFWLFKCVKIDVRLKLVCEVYLPGFFKPTPTDVRIHQQPSPNTRVPDFRFPIVSITSSCWAGKHVTFFNKRKQVCLLLRSTI